MRLRVGSRWKSAVDTTEVMVIRAPSSEVDLRCGGHPMAPPGDTVEAEPNPLYCDGTQLGKRYADEEIGLELLCTKPGKGSLSVGEQPLALKAAKALPTSD
jgi:hypothetical protein